MIEEERTLYAATAGDVWACSDCEVEMPIVDVSASPTGNHTVECPICNRKLHLRASQTETVRGITLTLRK